MFQGMFAIITPALISGAIVERMRFRGYIVFLVLWATLIYDPLAHWVWGSGGWLLKRGALDFAGGTVVHRRQASTKHRRTGHHGGELCRDPGCGVADAQVRLDSGPGEPERADPADRDTAVRHVGVGEQAAGRGGGSMYGRSGGVDFLEG